MVPTLTIAQFRRIHLKFDTIPFSLKLPDLAYDMRSTVLAIATCLISISTCLGQSSQSETTGNYVETLSHLEGVAVIVGVYKNGSRRKEIESEIQSQVEAKIRDARGVRLYTKRKEIEKYEETTPVLIIEVKANRTLQSVARVTGDGEADYDIEFVVEQDVIIKGTEKELRRDTYSVFGNATYGRYNTAEIDPASQAQRAIPLIVDQFIEDFRNAEAN